jgi:hypothetical protein
MVTGVILHFGGRIEDNLPPGTDSKILLGLLAVGTFMTVVYTLFGYRDHVWPYQVISGLSDQVPPLERAPQGWPGGGAG